MWLCVLSCKMFAGNQMISQLILTKELLLYGCICNVCASALSKWWCSYVSEMYVHVFRGDLGFNLYGLTLWRGVGSYHVHMNKVRKILCASHSWQCQLSSVSALVDVSTCPCRDTGRCVCVCEMTACVVHQIYKIHLHTERISGSSPERAACGCLDRSFDSRLCDLTVGTLNLSGGRKTWELVPPSLLC